MTGWFAVGCHREPGNGENVAGKPVFGQDGTTLCLQGSNIGRHGEHDNLLAKFDVWDLGDEERHMNMGL